MRCINYNSVYSGFYNKCNEYNEYNKYNKLYSKLFVFSVIFLLLFSFFSSFTFAVDTTDTIAGSDTKKTDTADGTGTSGTADKTTDKTSSDKTGTGTTAGADISAGSEEKVVPVSTGYDEQKSYDWLKTNMPKAATIFDQALSVVALNGKSINVQNLVDMLKLQQDSNTGCFPKGACKVSDTAVGMLALYSVNQDISNGKDYLLKAGNGALIPGLKQGEWRLQLDVTGSGTCKINYGAENKSKTFTIVNGTIKSTAGKYFIDISKELDGSLIGSKVSQSISVDCADLAGTISLVYYLRSSNSFFILDSQSLSAGAANLKIINACFRGTSGAGGCDLDATLLATWALVESDVSLSEIGTLTYLESTASSTNLNDLNKALLVRILWRAGNANTYFDNLLVSSNKNGAWGRGDNYNTAWGLFALQKGAGVYSDAVTSSTGYLQKRVSSDGSWGSVKNTAMTLIALHGADLAKGIVTPSSSGQEDTNAGVDAICAGTAKDRMDRTGCESPLCKTRSECKCENVELNCGGVCDPCEESGGKTADVDTETDLSEPSTEETPPKTEEKPADEGSSVWVWVIVLVLTLVLGGGGIIYYLNSQGKLDMLTGMFSEKTKGPSFEDYRRQAESNVQARPQAVGVQRPGAVQRPISQGQFPPISRVGIKTAPFKKPGYDDELEKSIKEAEKLLKGNK